jgi:long-subunit acyl-CoA synthetase (AMP-forming)
MDAVARLSARLDDWRGAPAAPPPAAPGDAGRATALLEAAEEALAVGGNAPRAVWEDYLALTRRPRFLTSLSDDAARHRWAGTTFRVIEGIDFTLGDLLRQRAAEHPDRLLLQETAEAGGGGWTYAQVLREVRATAALFLATGPRPELPPEAAPATDGPRVALLCANSVAAACCDLACLTHDILVTPLSVQMSVAELTWVFDRLAVTVAVCDHADRLDLLLAVRAQTARPFTVFTLFEGAEAPAAGVLRLDEERAKLEPALIERTLAERPRRALRDVTTVMFTSGSTGRPKGVAFSQYALVTKRFARAAALPRVGDHEVLLCYLPLFHTFGRYLELLGMLFWGGTYVFAGNPSAATLLNQLLEIRPTGLISVPVRWVQIRDRVRELADDPHSEAATPELVRDVVGDRLAWGLSAAGHLDPKVFRFFQRAGIALCSGFGMTEGTGGLTMTPPDDYVENSVGVPLPGVKVRFGDQDELQIAGPYIARYLPEEAPAGCLRVAEPGSDDHWLATGDLFRRADDGHLEIVDRIKDIYKNNRGQTIAPRVVESLFETVPGIARTFLAGDGRGYNTLLIVPDETDDVLRTLTRPEARREYFERIVTTANSGLAPYERVVDFALLDRDFSADRDELTPKGSLRRKAIEKNFAEVIAGLYRSNSRTISVGGYEVRVPRWFYRDLGLLDDALRAEAQALVNRRDGRRLVIAPAPDGRVRIGDLEYRLRGHVIDLGLLVSQPLLWLANAQLIEFGPCRPGWDTDPGPFSEQVTLPSGIHLDYAPLSDPARVDPQVRDVDRLCRQALFGSREEALAAVAELDGELGRVGQRRGVVIRRRLEALAGYPDHGVRCRAYQVLVLDQPVPDYHTWLPSFIDSGQSFLDDESVRAISRAGIEPRRLQALRQRMHSYRAQLAWPAPERTRLVFEDLLRLLADFGLHHPEFYNPIREELVTWTLHGADPELARAAHREFGRLAEWFEEQLNIDCDSLDPEAWRGRLVFQEGLSDEEADRLRRVLVGTTFLRHTLRVAFEGEDLRLSDIPAGGIWVSRIISSYRDSRYRVSVNTRQGKHFDIQLNIRDDFDQAEVMETVMWYIALRGYPFGPPMLPTFGCCRPELGALSMAYVSDLTVWEKIREFSSVRGPGTTPPSRMRWHQLLVRAMAVVVSGWRNSGRRLIPGLISPYNIVVPEPDFRQGALQNSLSGWRAYEGPLSLIRPLWRNIYQHTISHYPWTSEYLEREWIFEAFVEALGIDEATAWFAGLRDEMTAADAEDLGLGFGEALAGFVEALRARYYQPLDLKGAISRFADWQVVNGQAPLRAKLEIIEELSRLYRLDRSPELARYTMFRHTYFSGADARVLEVFDRLLERRFRQPQRRATQMVELSDLQAALADPDDLAAFNRMAFPHRSRTDTIEVLAVGQPGQDRVILRSTIQDRYGRSYVVGEPAGPADVGHLYRLFLRAGYPKSISSADRYLVAADETEQIVGGAVYRRTDTQTLFLDGIVVSAALAERGLEGAILADLCTRVKALGFVNIKTHFFLRSFFEKHGFRLDQRWGGLVRFL